VFAAFVIGVLVVQQRAVERFRSEQKEMIEQDRALRTGPTALPSDVDKNTLYFRGRKLRIIDLMDHGAHIHNRIFEDCQIFGPAVIYLRNTELLTCKFQMPQEAAPFWELAPNHRPVVGAIDLIDCRFIRCSFVGIGMLGTHEDIEKWKASATPDKKP
jgi:hypothetical protein